MSENPPPNLPPKQVVKELIIRMFNDGSVDVTGPLPEKVLCYGLLAMAHDSIKDWNDKQQKSNIINLPPGSRLAPL